LDIRQPIADSGAWIELDGALANDLTALQGGVRSRPIPGLPDLSRNIFSHVPSGKVKQVALMLKAIHAQESLEAAREKAGRIIKQLRAMHLRKAAEWVEQHIDETLSNYRYL